MMKNIIMINKNLFVVLNRCLRFRYFFGDRYAFFIKTNNLYKDSNSRIKTKASATEKGNNPVRRLSGLFMHL